MKVAPNGLSNIIAAIFLSQMVGCSKPFNDGRQNHSKPEVGTRNQEEALPIPEFKRVGKSARDHFVHISSIDISKDGRVLLTASTNDVVRYWKAPNFDDGRPLANRGEGILFVRYSPEEALIATGGANDIRVGAMESLNEFRTFTAMNVSFRAVDFSPDNKLLAAAAIDRGARGKIIVWDIASGAIRSEMISDEDWWQPLAVRFSPDGRSIAAGGRGAQATSIHVWDTHSNRTLLRLKGHSHPILSISYSPDGEYLASGGGDFSVRIWSIKDGRQIRRLGDFEGVACSVAFSPDGKLLAVFTRADQIHVYEVGNWDLLLRFEAPIFDSRLRREYFALLGIPDPFLRPIAFFPDSARLACGLPDNTTIIVDLREALRAKRP